MEDLTGWLGAAAGTSALVAVVAAFLRSILLAQKATSEQSTEWKTILDVKDTENASLRSEIACLRTQVREMDTENARLRRELREREP